MLRVLDAATQPQDMNQAARRLHPLKGRDHKGHFSVWVSGNWRLTFTFHGIDAELVDYQDYHSPRNTMISALSHPRPAAVLRDDVQPALGLSVTEAASQLGVSRITLSRVLNGRAGISPEMALRLQAWLGKERGGDAGLWLRMQANYDLWQAEQKFKVAAMRVRRAPLAA